MIRVSACTAYLSVRLSVCLILHISTRDRALKDVSTFTVSKLSYHFYCFFVPAGEGGGGSLGAFHVVLLPAGHGIISRGRLQLNILQKKEKKKVSSTCNTDNRFYCIYVERQIVLGERFVNCINRMKNFLFLVPGQM